MDIFDVPFLCGGNMLLLVIRLSFGVVAAFYSTFFLQHAVPSWPGFSETAYRHLNQDIMHLGDSFIRLAAMGR